GFGGTNTHVILEAPSPTTGSPASGEEQGATAETPAIAKRPKQLLALSSKTKPVLPLVAARYRDRLAELEDSDLADFCFSANTGRAHFNQRAALVAESREQMLEQLSALADGGKAKGMKQGEVRIATKPKLAFLFTGQGAQYGGMGKELYESQPLFRQILDQCNEIMQPLRERPLLEVMFADRSDGAINETQYTQPALFALEYALARLWQSWGVEPSMLLGHSVGEYVAACVAGVFDLETGLKLIAKRAELMQKMPANGTMAVIFTSRDRVTEALKPYGDRIAVATANGPENNVISGETKLVEEVVAEFEKEGIGTQKLTVSHAFHSPLMDPMLDEFEQFAATLTYERPRIPIVANRTGKLVESADLDAAYWRDHLRNCVEFDAGMRCLDEQGIDAYVEMGPTAALLGMGRRCLPNTEAAWLPAMRKGRDAWDSLLNAASELYLLGVNLDWRGFDAAEPHRKLPLPTYPFQRSPFWMNEETGAVLFGGGARGPAVHPLLGSPLVTALKSQIYECRFSSDSPKYLKDHQVQGSVVVPAAAYIEQGFASARETFGKGQHAVENIAIQQGMFLPAEGTRVVQVTIGAESGGRAAFETLSTSADSAAETQNWTLHLTGSIVHEESLGAAVPQLGFDREEFESRVIKRESQESFYEVLSERALVYGEAFTVLGDIARADREAVSQLNIPESIKGELDKYMLHPSIGDALMQMTSGVIPLEEDGSHAPYTYVPMRIRRVRVLGEITDGITAYSVRTSEHAHTSPEIVECNVYLLSADGEVIVEAEGVTIQRVGKAIGGAAVENTSDWLFDIDWNEQTLEPAEKSAAGSCLVIAADEATGETLRQAVNTAGGKTRVALLGDQLDEGSDRWTIRATEPEDYAAVMKAFAKQMSEPYHLLIATPLSLGSLDASAGAGSVVPVLRTIQQAARELGAKQPHTWVLTQGAQPLPGDEQPCAAQQATAWGMARVASVEHPELNVRLVDLDPAATLEASAPQLMAELIAQADENQLAFRADRRLVARLAAASERLAEGAGGDGMTLPAEGAYRLRISSAGSFDALYYENTAPPKPGPGQIAIEVKATGLNFSDVLKAMGLYPGIIDAIVPLGIECAGVVTALGEGATGFEVGDEVMGVAPYSFASHATTADYAMVKKPANLDFAEAASVPITFLTAYYGLVRLAHLQPGERVLIHAGAGGVGLAAIQICKQIGAEIFATAGSDEKREYLKSLGVDHVMNSRTLDFADEIMEITGREGVDVVLNSLPGDAIEKSLACLRAYGRFLEIGKTDIYSNSKVGLLPFQDNQSYFAIDLDRMLRQRGDYIRGLYDEVMPYFADERYESLPFTQFNTEETVEAFRYMAQRKNIGKVVVMMQPTSVEASQDEPPAIIRQEGTYLITGGLGALGMRVAQWMATQGAGHLVLMSRRAPSEEVLTQIGQLEQAGARVACVQGDVADLESLLGALAQIPGDFAPLSGVIHAAGVLADGVMFDMELDQLEKPLASKVIGTINLHEATKELPLDFFVMFSSVAAVLGSPGQSNYAAGNAFLDAMAQYRQAQGLPALSINWGPWAESGMAAEAGRDENVSGRGMTLLPADKALDVLGELLRAAVTQAAVMSVNWSDLLRNA
ncbi:MAG: SDR family NAD(P)-dependent oxidoreductase, partial [Planctomycetota bacterium]